MPPTVSEGIEMYINFFMQIFSKLCESTKFGKLDYRHSETVKIFKYQPGLGSTTVIVA